MTENTALAYDAILLVSFGGPKDRDQVIPFLENVLRGKNVPRQRLEAVAEHYYLFDGVSPLNAHCRALLENLGKELANRGIDLPLFWGNRNWHPMLAEAMTEMRERGCRRAIAFVTSAYSSYSGCRQYLEDIERARDEVGGGDLIIDKIPVFYDHPLFIEANSKNLAAALAKIPAARRAQARVAFTAHSLPASMAENCRYESQLRHTCQSVARSAEHGGWELVFQSRSGRPASAGWNRTFSITSSNCRRPASLILSCTPWAFSSTTWRSFSTWTRRRQNWRRNWESS